MAIGLIIGIISAIVFLVIIIWFISTYNKFVKIRNRIDNAWAQIDVQTKKRYDLVPNLVETVKGYAAHEKGVFTAVTEARAAISKAGSVEGKAQAENMLTGALKSLFAVSENYPELKANQNFRDLQVQLEGTENRISVARQRYNEAVERFNFSIRRFPNSLTNRLLLHLERKEYFEADAAAREAPKVEF